MHYLHQCSISLFEACMFKGSAGKYLGLLTACLSLMLNTICQICILWQCFTTWHKSTQIEVFIAPKQGYHHIPLTLMISFSGSGGKGICSEHGSAFNPQFQYFSAFLLSFVQ